METRQDKLIMLKQIEYHRWGLPIPVFVGGEALWVVKHTGEVLGRSRWDVRIAFINKLSTWLRVWFLRLSFGLILNALPFPWVVECWLFSAWRLFWAVWACRPVWGVSWRLLCWWYLRVWRRP